MAVYKYGDPESKNTGGNRKFVYDSLVNDKISRFLWSYYPNCDLHKHVPEYGEAVAARLSSRYFYQDILPNNRGDGRYCFHVDRLFTFDIKDERLHRFFWSKLKVQGGMTQVHAEKEFYESLIVLGYKPDDIDNKKLRALNISVAKVLAMPNHFKREVKELFAKYGVTAKAVSNENVLKKLREIIQRNQPGKDLEIFLAKVFRKIPGVIEVKENGRGWKSDHGADLIVEYDNGECAVIQIKSYIDSVEYTNAVSQLEMAINFYHADKGILITTGETTGQLEVPMHRLKLKMRNQNVEVKLIAGNEVSKFVLQYA